MKYSSTILIDMPNLSAVRSGELPSGLPAIPSSSHAVQQEIVGQNVSSRKSEMGILDSKLCYILRDCRLDLRLLGKYIAGCST